MENLAPLLQSLDLAKVLRDADIVVGIVAEAAPIAIDAMNKIEAIVHKHLTDSGTSPDEAAKLFNGLLQTLLASHTIPTVEKVNEVK